MAKKVKRIRPAKNKRRVCFSYDALCHYTCAQLLPGASSKPSRALDQLYREIDHCLFYEVSYEQPTRQIEAMLETLKDAGWKNPSKDDAISVLLLSPSELEEDTGQYLADEWLRRVGLPVLPPDRKQREFAEAIWNLKRLLREKGIPKGEADDMIAAGLGLPSGSALRKRLTPSRRK